MKATDRRTLRRRDIGLTVLGLGCAQMGGMYRSVPLRACQDLVSAAWDAGVRYFDTAPYYGYSRSERRLGVILDEHDRDGFVVSTKAGRVLVPDATVPDQEGEWVRPLPFRPVYDYTHDGILRSFDASRQRLGTTHVDILYIHDIGRMTHGDRHDHYWGELTRGGGFRALATLRDEGQIGAVGLGVNEWQVAADAMAEFDVDVTMLAGRYTLLEQTSLDFLDASHRCGHAIVAAGVFNSGILVGNNKFNYGDAPADVVAKVRELQTACDAFDVPLPAAALQFPLAHPAVVSCVVGARSAEQFATNVGWLETTIPDAFWQHLKERRLLHDLAPLPGAA